MDIVKFLQEGNKHKNPKYNPKTKKGAIEPPFITNYNPGDNIGDRSRASTTNALSRNMYNLNQYDVDKYAKYDVYVNPIQTEQELNQERAKNQSAWEQTGDFLTQAGVNEVVLGTALGISNLVDMATNLGEEEGSDDYTNPFSTWLENRQNDIKDRFEIYKNDPNATWAIGDFGWWADNAVSIASTASMLIPSVGIVKGVSAIGKVGKLGKISRGIDKAINKVGLTKTPATLAKAINAGTEIGATALLSRTMENYREARGVYNESYENTLNSINSMGDSDKEQLLNNNPQFIGKTNEEISQYISSVSADKTFVNDYAMLLFDIAQFKAIGSLWKGATNKATSASINRLNRNAAMSLNETGESSIKQLNFLQKRLDNIKYAAKHPITSIMAIGWSEGIEEGFQGIQTEKGKEVGKRILDPSYEERTLDDYLTDDAIWEQAFWGVLGGIGFQAIGTGLGNLSNKVKGHINKNKLTDEEFAITQLTDEKIRENEISSRKGVMQDFVDKIQTVNNNKNPYKVKVNQNGELVLEEGSKVFKDIATEEEKDIIKEQLVNDFITNISLNATDVGNYDLLKEFINDENFNKFFEEAGLQQTSGDKTFSKILIDKMDKVNELYSQALNDIITNTDVENENVAKYSARLIARNKLKYDDIQEKIDSLYNKLSEDPDSNLVDQNYIDWIRSNYADMRLKELAKIQTIKDSEFKSGKINKLAHKIITDNINEKRNSILNQVANNTKFGDIEAVKEIIKPIGKEKDIDKFINEFNNFFTNNIKQPVNENLIKESLQNVVLNIAAYEVASDELDSTIPRTQKEYKELYDNVSSEIDNYTIKKYDDAVNLINEYLESSENTDVAFDDLLNGNVNKEVKTALDIIKIASKNSNKYISQINMAVDIINKDKTKKEEESKVIIEDSVELKEEQANKQTKAINKIISDSNYSTGNQMKSDVENANVTNIPEIIDAAEEVAKSQAKIDEQNFNANANDYASIYAQRAVIDLFRTSPSIFEKLDNVDVTNEVFKRIVDFVIDNIIEKGVSPGIAKQAAYNGVKLAFNVRAIAMKNRNSTESDKFKKLAAEISIRSTIDIVEDKPAITKYLSDKELIDTIENFVEAYVKTKGLIKSKNGKVYVDIIDIFNELLNKDNNIGYDEAKFIFRNLKDYVIQNKSKNFIFINTKLLNDHLNNPETFMSALIERHKTIKNIDRYMHINPPSKKSEEYIETINNSKNGDDITIESSGNSMSIKKNGIEIGYIAKVAASNGNKTFAIQKQDKGFVYSITKNNNGVLTTTLDDFFNELINRETEDSKILFELVCKHKAIVSNKNDKEYITGDDWKIIKNLNIYNKLEKNNLFIIPSYIKEDYRKAEYLLNRIANVILYDNSITSVEELLHSYENWKENIFKNYTDTHTIQQNINSSNNKQIKVKLAGINNGLVLYNKNNRNVSELGFDSKANPIVAVNNEGKIINENNILPYINTPGFTIGSMGYLIEDNPNAPVIALITDTNKLTDNEKLTNEINIELTNLLTEYSSGKIGFDELGNSFQDLFGSFGIEHNNLFNGYSVIKNTNFIALSIQNQNNENNNKYNLIINRFEKNTNNEIINIIHFDKGNDSKISKITKPNANIINKITNDIISNLTFNKTFFSINNNAKINTSNNKYIYKKEGKFVTNIGGIETVYNNFSDFSIKNNIFKTNQGGNNITGYFDNSSITQSLYINIDNISSPVEEQYIVAETKSPTDIIREGNKTTPIKTRDILLSAGKNNEYIDALLGKGNFNIPIISEQVYYDANSPIKGAYYENNKVYFTKIGSGVESRYTPTNLVRLLIHESIHSKVDAENLFQGREYLVDELINTYTAFVTAVNKDTTNQGKVINKWVNDNNFTLDQYFEHLPENDKLKWQSSTEEQRRKQFAEEWLAESISQPAIMRYLNNIDYSTNSNISNLEDVNKTIWQKIIEVLIKLFNINKGIIKDNSILAQQYMILGDSTIAKQEANIDKISENNTEDSIIPIKENEIVTESDIEKTNIKPSININPEIDAKQEASNIYTEAEINTSTGSRNTITNNVNKILGGLNLNILPKLTNTIDSHGIAKGNELEFLINFLNKGVDASRRFDTAPLSSSSENVGSGLGTSSGTSYRDGLFIIASKPGEMLVTNGNTNIDTVLINDMNFDNDNPLGTEHAKKLKEVLTKKYPNTNFILFSEANEFYSNYTNKTTEEIEGADLNIFERNTNINKTTNRREKRDRSFAITEEIQSSEEIYAESYTNNTFINPTGIQTISDMGTYIKQFSENNKPLIASMIENNEIKFMCE